MDKQLLKAYIRTIVEEEVQRVLPKLLSEAVSEIKQIKEQVDAPKTKPAVDRSTLAQMMGLSYDGSTLSATTNNLAGAPVANMPPDVDPAVVKQVNRDYSAVMKKLGMSK